MSLFQRAHDIAAAKANKALDAAENPDEMPDYSYQQMLDHITQVRRALADITRHRSSPVRTPGSAAPALPRSPR